MMARYAVAGFLHNGELSMPVADFIQLRDGWSLSDTQRSLSDMHSKGTAFSSAVRVVGLDEFLSDEEITTIERLLALERQLVGEETGRPPISRLLDALLTAGAKMALQIPDIETLFPTKA